MSHLSRVLEGLSIIGARVFDHFIAQCPTINLLVIVVEEHLMRSSIDESTQQGSKGSKYYRCQSFGHFISQCPAINLLVEKHLMRMVTVIRSITPRMTLVMPRKR